MNISSIQNQPPSVVAQNASGPASMPVPPRVPADELQVAAPTKAERSGAQAYSSKQLEAAVQQVQSFTQSFTKELQFNIDKDSGQTIVKIVDSTTDEVIRQIPSEEMVAMAKALDQIQGLLIRQKA